jgi:hypothetical protein
MKVFSDRNIFLVEGGSIHADYIIQFNSIHFFIIYVLSQQQ